MSNRRILLLCPGAIDHFTPIWNSVRALCEHGYSVDLVSSTHDPARSPYHHPLLRVHSKHNLGARFWPRLLALAASRPALVWIHAPQLLAHPLTALLRFLRVPIVYHAHELYDRETHGPRIRWARLVLCPEPERAKIIRHWMAPDAQILVLPNTRFAGSVQPANRLRPLLGNRIVCIYQGLIAARRHLTQLIDAMALVPDGVGLAIIGSGDPADIEACDRRIAEKNLSARVHRIPHVSIEEILSLTADADIGILFYDPAHSLNNRLCAPNKLFEYMMIGLPMIGTECPGLHSFLGQLQLGELVDSSDPAAIAAAIRRLAADPTRRNQIADHGRTLFSSQWTYEKQVQPVLDSIDRITGN